MVIKVWLLEEGARFDSAVSHTGYAVLHELIFLCLGFLVYRMGTVALTSGVTERVN